MSIRKKYNIPDDAKVILYVGNISHNKNQAQMVRAYNLLPASVQENTYVLFCGSMEKDMEEVMLAVEQSPNKKHLIFCGVVAKTEMPQYYKTADGVALLSYVEGFGLGLVEGMHYGVPCMMHRDMDAFEDIFSERAVVGIENRDDQTVATAMRTLLDKEWDRDRIRSYSNKFAPAAMANGYLDVYEKVVI